uniref:Cyclin-dependent kinase inhibitor domain-containing protein n=1 Tax=Panagrolaimus sp. PS1159 TaxID=55785 RepID=A0AC35G300_9BILA
MPRESLFRRAAVPSHARRRLFPDSIDHEDLSQRLQAQLNAEVNVQSQRWGFDFRQGIPMNFDSSSSDTATASSSTSSETFIYESLNANEVPVLYRSNMILRKEIPRVGVVEIKHYPTGRGPIESPTKAVEPPPKPAESTRKRHLPSHSTTPMKLRKRRHLPSPSTTPMKLRKRVSPHKTPVNHGRNLNEHSASSSASSSKRSTRRNLTEKFEISSASAVQHSTSSSSKKDSCK